jgi:hypothetical protein
MAEPKNAVHNVPVGSCCPARCGDISCNSVRTQMDRNPNCEP